MRRWVTLFKILSLCTSCMGVYETYGQGFSGDTSLDLASLHKATNLYHSSLSPETGLYDGSQYTYDAYYPTIIGEGHPFFKSQRFDSGSVFYNNLLYGNVPLLYDIIKGELLINDPTKHYIIKLNNEKVQWFIISDHRFLHIMKASSENTVLHPGFYEVLYEGGIVLLKQNSKTMKENIAAVSGKDAFIVETDEYFIKKDNQYFKISSRKSLMPVVESDKKQVDQFIKKNGLNMKLNRLEVLNRKYFPGASVFNGVLSWTSYKEDMADYEPGANAVIIDYNGLQSEREFYSPVYVTEGQQASHIPDFRNVLLWSPHIKVAAGSSSEINFYTSDMPGKYLVQIQGLSKSGLAGSQVLGFEVKK